MPPKDPSTGSQGPRHPGSLLGLSEIAEQLGVSRQRAGQLAGRADFPRPEVELSSGRVWRADAIDRWVRKHRGGPRADPP